MIIARKIKTAKRKISKTTLFDSSGILTYCPVCAVREKVLFNQRCSWAGIPVSLYFYDRDNSYLRWIPYVPEINACVLVKPCPFKNSVIRVFKVNFSCVNFLVSDNSDLQPEYVKFSYVFHSEVDFHV